MVGEAPESHVLEPKRLFGEEWTRIEEIKEVFPVFIKINKNKQQQQQQSCPSLLVSVKIDKILKSLATGTKTKATVTSQYLNTTAQLGSCHQASHQQSQLRLAIHRIAYPLE
jgi:predicted solute-binding protein